MITNYGNVHDPARAKQLIVFEGVSSDGLGMTDVDGLLEYHNRAIIIYEVKSVGAPVPKGQRVALERLANNCHAAGKLAYAAVLEHTVFDTTKPVYVRDCAVREIYSARDKRWRKPTRAVTGGELTDVIIGLAKRLE